MNILIFTLGSRGDMQPYLALAVGLQRAGHRVTLATAPEFTTLIETYGVAAHPVSFSVQAIMQAPETRAIFKSRNPARQFRLMRDVMDKSAAAMDEFWAAAQSADVVVQTGTGNGGVEAQSQLGTGLVMTSVLPFPATSAFPSFFLEQRGSLGGAYNRLTHRLTQAMLWSALGGRPTNRFRTQRLGLKPWRSYDEMFRAARATGSPWLFAYSPSVLPKPADWQDYHHVTGYWYLDPPPNWQPPAELLRFLDDGPAPVYVGFGSMLADDPGRVTRMVLEALAQTGQRGVLQTGWGGVTREAAPANVAYVDDVPHAWLFPRMAAVVHHGGAGSTAAGLRAGLPSIVAPVTGDQHAWAQRVAQLGVGPAVGRLNKLTTARLAGAIDSAVNDGALRGRAAALGEKIRAEDGVATAVTVIEQYLAQHKPRRAATEVH